MTFGDFFFFFLLFSFPSECLADNMRGKHRGEAPRISFKWTRLVCEMGALLSSLRCFHHVPFDTATQPQLGPASGSKRGRQNGVLPSDLS